MSRFLVGGLLLMGVAGTLASAVDVAVAAPSQSAATMTASRGAAASRRSKHKKAAGPSLSVIGFGVNRLFVARGTTVKSSAMCDAMVGADGPIGPPQQVYLSVYLHATDIPADAPTEIKDSLPGGSEELDIPNFEAPTPFSKIFDKGSFSFGAPSGNQDDLFHTFIVSYSAEEGTYEGPSAEEFDGTYSYTASVAVGPHTLASTANVTVECPYLR